MIPTIHSVLIIFYYHRWQLHVFIEVKFYLGMFASWLRYRVINDCLKHIVRYSKLTALTEHSLIKSTDQHYNPLRNALLKSQFSVQFISHPSQLDQQNLHSHLFSKVCKLTPQLAKKIRNTSFIPIEAELVPTKNLYKVAGKDFIILDVQEKTSDALTASQFQRLPPNNFQQIVYQIRDNSSSLLSASTNQKIKKIKLTNHASKELQQNINGNATIQTAHRFDTTNVEVPTKAFHIENSQEYVSSVNNHYSRISISQGIQKYKFKKNLLSQGSTHTASSLCKKKKKDYKYNLFSLLDELGNNGCRGGQLFNNQICAARISNYNWN